MRTNIELDDVLLIEAMSLTKLRTKKDGKVRFRSIDQENKKAGIGFAFG